MTGKSALALMLLNLAAFSMVASCSGTFFDGDLMDPWIPLPEIEPFPENEFNDLMMTAPDNSTIVLPATSGASAPEEEWSMTFGGTDGDGGYSVQQTNDGGYVIAGIT
jgi:hypothetical protein